MEELENRDINMIQHETMQESIAIFGRFIENDKMQDWAKVVFIAQYVCYVTFERLGTSILELPKYKTTQKNQVTFYLRQVISRDSLYTGFIEALPNNGLKTGYAMHKKAANRLLEMFIVTKGVNFHPFFRQHCFFVDKPHEAHAHVALCVHVFGPALASFVSKITLHNGTVQGSTTGIPTVAAGAMTFAHVWENDRQRALDAHAAAFSVPHPRAIHLAHASNRMTYAPLPTAVAASDGTNYEEMGWKRTVMLPINVLTLVRAPATTPTMLTPITSMSRDTSLLTASGSHKRGELSQAQLRQEMAFSWLHVPPNPNPRPALAVQMARLAHDAASVHPHVDAHLAVGEWSNDKERTQALTMLSVHFAARHYPNPHLIYDPVFKVDRHQRGHPQLFELSYPKPPVPDHPNELPLYRLHDQGVVYKWSNEGTLQTLASRNFNGDWKHTETSTALLNAGRVLSNASTYVHISSTITDFKSDCQQRRILLPNIPREMEDLDAATLLGHMYTRAPLLLSTGASRPFSYRREDMVIQNIQGQLLVIAFNENTRMALGGARLEEREDDWHPCYANDKEHDIGARHDANMEILLALDKLVRCSPQPKNTVHKTPWFEVMLQPMKQLIVPAGFWVAYTACTPVIGTLHTPIDGWTLARTAHTLEARPMPATPVGAVTNPAQRGPELRRLIAKQYAVVTAIRRSLWVATAVAFSRQANLRYMLRAVQKESPHAYRMDCAISDRSLDALGASTGVLLELYHRLHESDVACRETLKLVRDDTRSTALSTSQLRHKAPGVTSNEPLLQVQQSLRKHGGTLPRKMPLVTLRPQLLTVVAGTGATQHEIPKAAMKIIMSWVREGQEGALTQEQRHILEQHFVEDTCLEDDSEQSTDSDSSSSSTSSASTTSDTSMHSDSTSNDTAVFLGAALQHTITDGSMPLPLVLQAYPQPDLTTLSSEARERINCFDDGRVTITHVEGSAFTSGNAPQNALQDCFHNEGYLVAQHVVTHGLREVAEIAQKAVQVDKAGPVQFHQNSNWPRPKGHPPLALTHTAAKELVARMVDVLERFGWPLNKHRQIHERGHVRSYTSKAGGHWNRVYDYEAWAEQQQATPDQPLRVTRDSVPAICFIALTPSAIDIAGKGTISVPRGALLMLRGDVAYRHTNASAALPKSFYSVYLETPVTGAMRKRRLRRENATEWAIQCTRIHKDVTKALRKTTDVVSVEDTLRPRPVPVKSEKQSLDREQTAELVHADIASHWQHRFRMTEADYVFVEPEPISDPGFVSEPVDANEDSEDNFYGIFDSNFREAEKTMRAHEQAAQEQAVNGNYGGSPGQSGSVPSLPRLSTFDSPTWDGPICNNSLCLLYDAHSAAHCNSNSTRSKAPVRRATTGASRAPSAALEQGSSETRSPTQKQGTSNPRSPASTSIASSGSGRPALAHSNGSEARSPALASIASSGLGRPPPAPGSKSESRNPMQKQGTSNPRSPALARLASSGSGRPAPAHSDTSTRSSASSARGPNDAATASNREETLENEHREEGEIHSDEPMEDASTYQKANVRVATLDFSPPLAPLSSSSTHTASPVTADSSLSQLAAACLALPASWPAATARTQHPSNSSDSSKKPSASTPMKARDPRRRSDRKRKAPTELNNGKNTCRAKHHQKK